MTCSKILYIFFLNYKKCLFALKIQKILQIFHTPEPSRQQVKTQVDTLELAISRRMVGDDNPEMYIFESLNGTGCRCRPDDENCRYGVVWNQTRTEIEHLVDIRFAEPREQILQYFFLFANPNTNKGNAYELYLHIGNCSLFVINMNSGKFVNALRCRNLLFFYYSLDLEISFGPIKRN